MAIAAERITGASFPVVDVPLKDRVRSILASRFPQATIEFYKRTPQIKRISGNVYWEGFEGVSTTERQRMVWGALEEYLTEDELENEITGFHTFTPFENTFIEQPEEGHTEP